MNKKLPAAVAGLAIGVAACSSPPPRPPSAWSLAARLPRCSPTVLTGTDLSRLISRQAVSCNAGQFRGTEIATFRNQKNTRAWYAVNTEFVRLTEAHPGESPLGVIGNGWVAVLSAAPPPGEAQTVQHYLGGKIAR